MTLEKGLWDRLVNSKWPDGMPVPTEQEAISGAKRLYRKAMGRPWTGKVRGTRGNRRTWIRGGTLIVNPNEVRWNGLGGWAEIVHSISHYAHWRLHPKDAPHSSRQAYIERDLAEYVVNQGWLDGKMKSKAAEKPKPDVVRVRYQRILDREAKWKKQLSRAENALAKASRERRTYERRHGERVLT